jgi:hypothetical protein
LHFPGFAFRAVGAAVFTCIIVVLPQDFRGC